MQAIKILILGPTLWLCFMSVMYISKLSLSYHPNCPVMFNLREQDRKIITLSSLPESMKLFDACNSG